MNLSPVHLAEAPPVPCALWRMALDQQVPAAARERLSAAEQARAARFVFARDRERYVAAHAALRQLLAMHFANLGRSGDAAAGSQAFVTGRHGKPALAAPASLHFNLSHSGGMGMVALSEERELGIDVEQLRPVKDATAMAAAYFSPAERVALAACDEATRDRAFLVCWTRKEACLKALGIGLYLATRSFDVGVEPDTRIVEIATPDGIERVHLQSFADGDTIAALALRGMPHAVGSNRIAASFSTEANP